ncbi:MAG: SEC-C domain-containing protein [Bdellovibrionales bacterium]|nr:SEC-C domain-containing protein [Bdellovibrionales bacterium]
MKAGRNDPCPCGSGNKFKRCCQSKTVFEFDDELPLRRLRRTRDEVAEKVLAFTKSHLDENDFALAWEEWCLQVEEAIGANDPEVATFASWFVFGFVAPKYKRKPSMRIPSAHLFYNRHKSELDERQRAYLESVLTAPLSFYEVIEADPGRALRLRCLFTGQETDVLERQGSKESMKGCALFGRIGRGEGIAIFDSVTDLLIPSSEKVSILDLRLSLKRLLKLKPDALLEPIHLFRFDYEVRSLYRAIRDKYLNPRPPQMTNTDGHEISFNQVIFTIEDPNGVFDRIHSLCIHSSAKDLLSEAKRAQDGVIEHLEFSWTKRGNRANRGMKNTVLGKITIKKNQLVIEVNSNERAAMIRSLIEERCGTLARYQTTLYESMDSVRERSEDRSGQRDHEELMKIPEVREQMRAMLRKHMETWPRSKLPALGNKTPRQAVKTQEGREMVLALLHDFEKRAGHLEDREFELDLIRGVRRTLGLTE